jgi:hypothetical protein
MIQVNNNRTKGDTTTVEIGLNRLASCTLVSIVVLHTDHLP